MGSRGPKSYRNYPLSDRGCCRLDAVKLLTDKDLNLGASLEIEWCENGRVLDVVGVKLDENLGNILRVAYELRAPGRPPEQVLEHIDIVMTACHFGGERRWFLCPGCGYRARFLAGAERFLCQRCFRLRFPSQYLSRTLNRIRKIRQRLNSHPSQPIAEIIPPRWMRADRVRELIFELIRLEGQRTLEVTTSRLS